MTQHLVVASRERRWTVIAGATPLVLAGLLYLHVAVVRVLMGGLPDPDSLPQPLYAWNVFSTLSIFAVALLLPVLSLIGLLLSVFRSFRRFRNPSIALLIGVCLGALLVKLDLSGGLRWVMD